MVHHFEYGSHILFTLRGKSIHLAGKVYKFFLDLAGKVYTFPSVKKRITYICGKLGKVDKFLVFHIRILYNIGGCPFVCPSVCHKFYIQLAPPISPEIIDRF